MISWINCCILIFIALSSRNRLNDALPLPDVQDAIPKNLPFSLDLEPPFPDDSNGSNRPVVLPLRDSYGNPIPPSVLGVDPSGVDYGLSPPVPPQPSINSKQSVQGINFPIPSYASGITEIHRPSDGLLPPFDSTKPKPSSATTLFDVDPSSQSSFSTVQSVPASDLLPPSVLQNTPTHKDDEINEISGILNFNAPIPDSPSVSNSPTSTTALSINNSTQESDESNAKSPLSTEVTEVLGEQQEVRNRVKLSTTTIAPIPEITARIDLSPNFDREPIGVAPPQSFDVAPSQNFNVAPPQNFNVPSLQNFGAAIPALSKVLLPPFVSPEQQRENADLYTSTTTDRSSPEPEIIRTPLQSNPLIVDLPIKESESQEPAALAPTKISIPINDQAPTAESEANQQLLSASIPAPATFLLPPPYSSNSQPFQPPSITKPTSTTTSTTTTTTTTTIDTSALSRFGNIDSKPNQSSTFLSIPFGFPNKSPNQLPDINQTSKSSQHVAIGKALQDRFGSNFDVQQLPINVNSLEHVTKQQQQQHSKSAIAAPSAPPASDSPSAVAPEVAQAPVAVAPAPVQPNSLPSVPKAPTFVSGKYTGGFGGPPGILGEQTQLGFDVKPDEAEMISIAARATAPADPPANVPARQPLTFRLIGGVEAAPPPAIPGGILGPTGRFISGHYTGSFGGPPGILLPYDDGSDKDSQSRNS